MKEISYLFAKLRYRVHGRDNEIMSSFFRKNGISVGEKCNICSNIITTESYLISLGNNVTIAGGVRMITHDNSVSKLLSNCTDIFGRITIGDNCFIGAESILMYGVKITNNVIVASGSVVTKSVMKEGVIVGGNPARIISTYDRFIAKNRKNVFNLNAMNKSELESNIANSIRLIYRSEMNDSYYE